MKKQMILADGDELYLTNLSNYFMEKAPQLELNLFTDKEMLCQYLEQGEKADILVIDEDFVSKDIRALAGDMTKIVLSASMTAFPGFEFVRKYQKTESLLNEIMLKYAENTGCLESVQGKSNTRIVTFYSPAGGTGKTTLALALATVSRDFGFRTLYLNLEEVPSIKNVLQETPGNMSEVFLALKTKGMNPGIKLASSVAVDSNGGFWYLSGVDSISEYEEIDENDIHRFLESVRILSEYDLVILDTSSGMSQKKKQILLDSDLIFVPVVSCEGAVAKMMRYLEEIEIHEIYHSIFSKMSLIVNETSISGYGAELQESGLLQKMSCGAAIVSSPVLKKYANVIRSRASIRQVMEPLIQMIRML